MKNESILIETCDKSSKVKDEILRQYASIRAFSRESGIPHGTIVSGINRGIEGMAYDKVIQICDTLNIDYVTFEPNYVESKSNEIAADEKVLLANYRQLSDEKKKKVLEYIKDIK